MRKLLCFKVIRIQILFYLKKTTKITVACLATGNILPFPGFEMRQTLDNLSLLLFTKARKCPKNLRLIVIISYLCFSMTRDQTAGTLDQMVAKAGT